MPSTDVTPILKVLYPKGRPKKPLYKAGKFYQLVAKDPTFKGEYVKSPLQISGHNGRSASISRAIANKGAEEKRRAFQIDVVEDFAVYTVDELDMRRTEGDDGAFVRLLKSRVDAAMYSVERSFSNKIWRNGGGALGQISAGSTVGSPTITLANPSDVRFFEVGMIVQASADDGTGGAGTRSSGARATIGAINRQSGTLTVASGPNWDDNIAAIAAGDYLFADGDYAAAMKGVLAWTPASAPSSTAFFGVDRTVDTERLSGVRADLSALQAEEALTEAVRLVGDAGGDPDRVWVNSKLYRQLGDALRGVFAPAELKAYENPTVGIRTLRGMACGHEVDVMCDPDMPEGYMAVHTSSTWKLWSAGPHYSVFDRDGKSILREADSDGVEGRIYAYPQLECSCPGWNGIFTV